MQHFTQSRLRAVFLCLTLSSVASAQEVKTDIGVTQFTQAENGTWYQDGFAHTLHLTSPSASLKLYTDKFDGWQVGIGVDYIGRATSDAMVLDADANYSAVNKTHCNGQCGPLSHLTGHGTIPSLFIALRKNYDRWIVELEYYRTRPQWETYNEDWYSWWGSPAIQSRTWHQTKSIYDLSAAIGYRIDDKFNLLLKAVPTHASNSQIDPTSPSGSSYFPGIYKAYSPTLAIEYSF